MYMYIHLSLYISISIFLSLSLYIYIYMYTLKWHAATRFMMSRNISEKGEMLLRGVGTLRYLLILSDNSACQVPICAVAA